MPATLTDPDHQKEAIGRRLRAFREALNLESGEFASRIGVAPNTYSQWEVGRSMPDIHAMGRVCEFFSATMDFIYLGRGGGLPVNLAPLIAEKLNALAEIPQDQLARRGRRAQPRQTRRAG